MEVNHLEFNENAKSFDACFNGQAICLPKDCNSFRLHSECVDFFFRQHITELSVIAEEECNLPECAVLQHSFYNEMSLDVLFGVYVVRSKTYFDSTYSDYYRLTETIPAKSFVKVYLLDNDDYSNIIANDKHNNCDKSSNSNCNNLSNSIINNKQRKCLITFSTKDVRFNICGESLSDKSESLLNDKIASIKEKQQKKFSDIQFEKSKRFTTAAFRKKYFNRRIKDQYLLIDAFENYNHEISSSYGGDDISGEDILRLCTDNFVFYFKNNYSNLNTTHFKKLHEEGKNLVQEFRVIGRFSAIATSSESIYLSDWRTLPYSTSTCVIQMFNYFLDYRTSSFNFSECNLNTNDSLLQKFLSHSYTTEAIKNLKQRVNSEKYKRIGDPKFMDFVLLQAPKELVLLYLD